MHQFLLLTFVAVVGILPSCDAQIYDQIPRQVDKRQSQLSPSALASIVAGLPPQYLQPHPPAQTLPQTQPIRPRPPGSFSPQPFPYEAWLNRPNIGNIIAGLGWPYGVGTARPTTPING